MHKVEAFDVGNYLSNGLDQDYRNSMIGFYKKVKVSDDDLLGDTKFEVKPAFAVIAMGSICGTGTQQDTDEIDYGDLPNEKLTIDRFLGKWSLTSHMGYDAYLKALGVKKINRKMLVSSPCKYDIYRDEEKQIVWKFKCIGKTVKYVFQLNGEFEAKTIENRHTKVIFTIESDELIETQTDPEHTHNIIRTLTDDETMVEVSYYPESLYRKTFVKKAQKG